MQIANVTSSNVVRIGYKNGTLYCLFHHGGAYAYPGVKESVFNDFKAAESAGKFFHAEVKPFFTAVKLPVEYDEYKFLCAHPAAPLEKVPA